MPKYIVIAAILLSGCFTHRNYYIEQNLQDIERREKFIWDNEWLSLKVKRLILEGKVCIGMVKAEVKAAKGLPIQAEELSCRMYGMEEYCLERWIYDNGGVVFRNGILIKEY